MTTSADDDPAMRATRAGIESAAKERYPYFSARAWAERAAYIQGRLDQAEADARVAEGYRLGEPPFSGDAADLRDHTRRGIAAAIRKGAQ